MNLQDILGLFNGEKTLELQDTFDSIRKANVLAWVRASSDKIYSALESHQLSPEIDRYFKRINPDRCGLIKLTEDPPQDPQTLPQETIRKLLKNQNGIILYNNECYYADIQHKWSNQPIAQPAVAQPVDQAIGVGLQRGRPLPAAAGSSVVQPLHVEQPAVSGDIALQPFTLTHIAVPADKAKELQQLKENIGRLGNEVYRKSDPKVDSLIFAVTGYRHEEQEPFSNFQSEPAQISQLKKILNVLHHVEIILVDIELYDAQDLVNELYTLSMSDMLTPSRLENFFSTTKLANLIHHLYEAGMIAIHPDVNLGELFSEEINLLKPLFAYLQKKAIVLQGEANDYIRQNLPDLPRQVGEVAGNLIDRINPEREAAGYDFLAKFSVALPSYLKKLSDYLNEYSVQINVQNIDQEQLKLLQDHAYQLLNSLRDMKEGSLFLSLQIVHYIHIIEHITKLSMSIISQSGQLSDSGQDAARAKLSLLKYQLLPALFSLSDKIEAHLMLQPGTLSDPMMREISKYYQTLLHYVKKFVNFSVNGRELLAIEDNQFVTARADYLIKRIAEQEKKRFVTDGIQAACEAFFTLLQQQVDNAKHIYKLPREVKNRLSEYYKVIQPYVVQIDRQWDDEIVEELLKQDIAPQQPGVVSRGAGYFKDKVVSVWHYFSPPKEVEAVEEPNFIQPKLEFKTKLDLLLSKMRDTSQFHARLYHNILDRITNGSQEGYDLGLMSSFPENDATKAKKGIIYLSENPRQYYVKGMEKPADIPAEIDLRDLETKLQNSTFRTAILDLTSKAGHTRQEHLRLYPHNTANNPFVVDESACLGELLPSSDTIHFKKSGEINQITNLEQLSSEQALNLYKIYQTNLLKLNRAREAYAQFRAMLSTRGAARVFEDFTLEGRKKLGYLYSQFQPYLVNGLLSANNGSIKELDKDLTGIFLLGIGSASQQPARVVPVSEIPSPVSVPQAHDDDEADEEDDSVEQFYDAELNSGEEIDEPIGHSTAVFLALENDVQAHFASAAEQLERRQTVVVAAINALSVKETNEKQLAKSPVDPRAGFVIKHKEFSKHISAFSDTIEKYLDRFNHSIKQQILATKQQEGVPFPELEDVNRTLATSEQILTIKKIYNCLYYFKDAFNRIEDLPNKFSYISIPDRLRPELLTDKLEFFVKLALAIKSMKNAGVLAYQLLSNQYITDTASDLKQKLQTLITKSQELQTMYFWVDEPEDALPEDIQNQAITPPPSGEQEIVSTQSRTAHNIIQYATNILHLLPEHINAHLARRNLTDEEVADIHQHAAEVTEDIDGIIADADSYFKLFFDSLTIYDLFKELKEKLSTMAGTVNQVVMENLGEINNKLLATLLLKADEYEDGLGLFPGTITGKLKAIIDAFFQGMLAPLELKSPEYLALVTSSIPIQKRFEAVHKRIADARIAQAAIQTNLINLKPLYDNIGLYIHASPGSGREAIKAQLVASFFQALPILQQAIPHLPELDLPRDVAHQRMELIDKVLNEQNYRPKLENIINLVPAAASYFLGLIATEEQKINNAKEKLGFIERLKYEQFNHNQESKSRYTDRLFNNQLQLIAKKPVNLTDHANEYRDKLADFLNCGYDLELMSSLPENDISKAKKGIIYLSESPRQYYVQGMKKPADMPVEIDLRHLETKLQDSALKTVILNVTSKAGHTVSNRKQIVSEALCHETNIEDKVHQLLCQKACEFEQKNYRDFYYLEQIKAAIFRLSDYLNQPAFASDRAFFENDRTLTEKSNLMNQLKSIAINKNLSIPQRITEIKKITDLTHTFKHTLLDYNKYNSFTFNWLKQCVLALLELIGFYTSERRKAYNVMTKSLQDPPEFAVLVTKQFGLFSQKAAAYNSVVPQAANQAPSGQTDPEPAPASERLVMVS